MYVMCGVEYSCFNRTFMELKFPFLDMVICVRSVLIVPLWN